MVMTSVIYDDMLITGRLLDGKMSVEFTAKNGNTTEISSEKPTDIMVFVKENIFNVVDDAIQYLTNNEELWADIREKVMIENNELQRASSQGGLFIESKNRKVSANLIYEDTNENFIHQKFLTEFQDFETPYREYEYDVKVHGSLSIK